MEGTKLASGWKGFRYALVVGVGVRPGFRVARLVLCRIGMKTPVENFRVRVYPILRRNRLRSRRASLMIMSAMGNSGLDYVLGGGLVPKRMYLLEGDPGTGKTSLGLQYLMEGAARGERVLHITLAESRSELQDIALSHGWDLSGVVIEELLPEETLLDPDAHYTMFHPSEVELGESLKQIFERARDLKPHRIVIDSLSEIRLLAGDPLRYRRQLMALKRFFTEYDTTVLLLDDLTGPESALQLHSLAHGVITLEQVIPDYGSERRRLLIRKMRGRSYIGGYHDFRIIRGGVEVYPRVTAVNRKEAAEHTLLPSGVKELDALLGEGLHRGTSTLLLGPAGVGKTSLAAQYAAAAADRGETVVVFLFDEQQSTLRKRCAALGMNLDSKIADGKLLIREFVPATVTPGEISHRLHELIAKHNVTLFVLDSLNGYLNALSGQSHLLVQLHEMLSVLARSAVTTIMVGAQHGILGADLSSPVDASYLTDSLVLFRFFEAAGQVRRAISVVKKRSGLHEHTIREFILRDGGIEVGPALKDFQGVLSGQPTFHGQDKPLL